MLHPFVSMQNERSHTSMQKRKRSNSLKCLTNNVTFLCIVVLHFYVVQCIHTDSNAAILSFHIIANITKVILLHFKQQ